MLPMSKLQLKATPQLGSRLLPTTTDSFTRARIPSAPTPRFSVIVELKTRIACPWTAGVGDLAKPRVVLMSPLLVMVQFSSFSLSPVKASLPLPVIVVL